VDARGRRPAALMFGVQESARWLAHLHTKPLRIGRPISLLISGEVMSLNKRRSKVIAKRPDYLEVALDMNARLERLAEDTEDGILVQSHGQYRPIHVFARARPSRRSTSTAPGPATPRGTWPSTSTGCG
ncbi:MAG: hypothetical protein ACRDKW_04840, partial [Actinomycetota bacterium]